MGTQKEIQLARETEMPGLMALKEYGPSQPLKGAKYSRLSAYDNSNCCFDQNFS